MSSWHSRRGLDGLAFLMADVRDGLGPDGSVYLKQDQHWGAGAIGIVMAVYSIAAACSQVPAGLLVDATRAKRSLLAGSGLLVALGCPGGLQVRHGVAAGISTSSPC